MSEDHLIQTPMHKNLTVSKGARHCRIVDEDDNIVFRTTNLRDAEAYLALVEENRRLHRLMEARGIAPHRIYLLENGEIRDEVVIVAKAGPDSVVVRNLNDGIEKVIELEELKTLPNANYFSGSERPIETVHVSVRLDAEAESAIIHVHRSTEGARGSRDVWRRTTFEPDKDEGMSPSLSNETSTVFTGEVVIED